MAIEQTLESLEFIRKSMEAIKSNRAEAVRYLAMIDEELGKLQAQERELAVQSVGQYRGRSQWTYAEMVDARRGIRSCTGEARTVGEICQALPNLDRALIEREVDYLVSRNCLVWSGKRGPGSTYRRAQ
jgi:hypothetical protein